MNLPINKMVKVYGYSDDLVEVEGRRDYEVDCYDAIVRLTFEDGTVIKASYPKDGFAVWDIEVEKEGYAEQILVRCPADDEENYSDVFYIDSEVKDWEVIPN